MSGDYEAPSINDKAIWDLWLSMHHLPAATAAEEVGIFDALCETPLSFDALADKLSLNRRALSALMAMLCGLNLVTRREGVYRPAPVTRAYLKSDSDYFWGPLFSSYKDESRVHKQLLELLKQGETDMSGRPVEGWAAGKITPEAAQFIAKFMHAHSLPAAVAAARSGAFRGVKKFLDVGGGSGVFAIAAAQRDPALQATIMDLDTMCAAAEEIFVKGSGVEARVDTVAVDMFREDWPQGYDALFFSNVFHDWNEKTNAELARRSYDALPSGGRIFLHEMLMNDNEDGPLTTASFSMLMLRGTQGKQYTLRELTAILEGAGFTGVEAIQTSPYYSVVSAGKA
ncbi:methyltransferase [Hyphococcus luteus]|uniref:Methyltransferase n=1 Tax=Hyphococcus luteus TaxID=2058213 RepID=A0A2S7K5Y6_9PROT|nr:methyltransferase [Marinicaulis flavus]PQA87902.1 hypothetical protein CW354_06020 [Marinicaulis flavus]